MKSAPPLGSIVASLVIALTTGCEAKVPCMSHLDCDRSRTCVDHVCMVATAADAGARPAGDGGDAEDARRATPVVDGGTEPTVCAPGESIACYGGDPALAGIGVCTLGLEQCIDDGEFGHWGSCEGWGAPSASDSTCDGADDDCDGTADEDCDICEAVRSAPPDLSTGHTGSVSLPGCSGGYTSSNYVRSAETLTPGATAELHVIGVYESTTHTVGAHTIGPIRVNVRPTRLPMLLSLNAYEPIQWDIVVTPGASLAGVIAQGYYTPVVTGVPAGVPVTIGGYDRMCSCGYGWEPERRTGGCDTALTIGSARVQTGIVETSFQGCYQAFELNVPFT